MKDEIIVYQADESSTRLEVRIDEDTVWLAQAQMADLFLTSSQNITMHIKNIYKEGELSETATCKDYLQVQLEGGRKVKRNLRLYNLDVIISVGYRVKSLRGTQFRIWANKILKEYLLKGHIVNNRIERLENDIHNVKNKLLEIDLKIKTNLPPNEGIFFDGQTFDAYFFITDLVKKAKSSIILIDNYIDESVLLLLSKKQFGVEIIVYTSTLSKQAKLDIIKFSSQYNDIEIKQFNKSHDRFLIIDRKTVYHIGASLKDLGKKWFAFSIINFDVKEILKKLN